MYVVVKIEELYYITGQTDTRDAEVLETAAGEAEPAGAAAPAGDGAAAAGEGRCGPPAAAGRQAEPRLSAGVSPAPGAPPRPVPLLLHRGLGTPHVTPVTRGHVSRSADIHIFNIFM